MENVFTQGQPSKHKIYEQRYKSARMNLLLVVVFTAVNLLLLVTNSDLYFLFSAFVPYFITTIGMVLCRRFPAELYTGGLEDLPILDNSFFVILLVISIVFTLLYLAAWLFSNKNRIGWLIFALVFFGIDTFALLFINGIALDSIFDLLFHAWVIYYLVVGVTAHYQLKKLPPEEPAFTYENISIPNEEENLTQRTEESQNSHVIREADNSVKHRAFVEAQVLDYHICYRRVKHTNELVINGNVYDELEGIFEYPHTLKAWIDGHYIAAGYTGTHSFISVDGEKVANKLRLF